MIGFIAAMTSDQTIAIDGQIPWHSPEDMHRFKQVTFGSVVIMGRKTWETLPGPLSGRTNIVVTRDEDYTAVGADCVNLDDAIEIANARAKVWVIGGEGIFRAFYERQKPDLIDITWISGTYALAPRKSKTMFPITRKELVQSYRMVSFERGKEVIGFQRFERK